MVRRGKGSCENSWIMRQHFATSFGTESDRYNFFWVETDADIFAFLKPELKGIATHVKLMVLRRRGVNEFPRGARAFTRSATWKV